MFRVSLPCTFHSKPFGVRANMEIHAFITGVVQFEFTTTLLLADLRFLETEDSYVGAYRDGTAARRVWPDSVANHQES